MSAPPLRRVMPPEGLPDPGWVERHAPQPFCSWCGQSLRIVLRHHSLGHVWLCPDCDLLARRTQPPEDDR